MRPTRVLDGIVKAIQCNYREHFANNCEVKKTKNGYDILIRCYESHSSPWYNQYDFIVNHDFSVTFKQEKEFEDNDDFEEVVCAREIVKRFVERLTTQ